MIVLMILNSTAFAKFSDNSWGYISPSIGWYRFTKDQALDHGPFVGIHAGYHLSKPLAFEIGWKTGWFDSNCDSHAWDSETINGHSLYFSGLYYFSPDQKLNPFAHLGFSNIKFDTDTINDCYDSFKYGVGFNYYLSARTAFRSRLSHHITTKHSYNNYSIDFGLLFLFDLDDQSRQNDQSIYGSKKNNVSMPHIDHKNTPDDNLLKPVHDLPRDSEDKGNSNKSAFTDTASETTTEKMTAKETDALQHIESAKSPLLDKVIDLPHEQKIDIDFDSVVDTIDQCPDTADDTLVDLSGCPVNVHNTFDETKYNRCVASADGILSNPHGCHLVTPVYFDTNKSTINKNAMLQLKKMVFLLRSYPEIKVGIWGHTDNEGAPDYNKALSLQRAQTVADYFIDNNISENRLEIKGFGLAKPVVPNTSHQYKSKNRRVELILILNPFGLEN
ncbi:MAG: OmpA-OmpF porin, OOP family [Candidatus Magnetoglobus multicellularis str. Araruama]|uniref:OmpA-OmpF porin, OOP family n=1 Tax=Candidatus Magnetoglobus multicellularis str. Araruama TaxID=890399 RepID=A0A1V1P6L5_9BACT|nr:MAG: OmpA-OmpF porin, OOP family [Candidatus Magnetoglobus multicellularis str. Araruama]